LTPFFPPPHQRRVIGMRRIALLLASIAVAMLLASGVALAQAEDTTPPETTLSSWERPDPYDYRTNATFGFSSNETGVVFECKLDEGSFQACASPKSYYSLTEGQHTFQVQARDAAGNVDPTPAEYAWEIDLTDPEMTWTERPGRDVGSDEWVTSDTTPTWAYEFSDKNLRESEPSCDLYNRTLSRYVVTSQPCTSPMTFPFELADGYYYFEVWHYDKAYNSGYYWQDLEVDTAAPKFVSGKPTGRRVSRYAWIKATFDDRVYGSAKYVNIYKRGSNRPLALDDRWVSGKSVELNPKGYLKRGTSYTVKVTTGVNDGANNLEAPYSWTFKTKR
jgi:hypothetical protein